MEEDLVDYSTDPMEAMAIRAEDPPQHVILVSLVAVGEPDEQVDAYILVVGEGEVSLSTLGFKPSETTPWLTATNEPLASYLAFSQPQPVFSISSPSEILLWEQEQLSSLGTGLREASTAQDGVYRAEEDVICSDVLRRRGT